MIMITLFGLLARLPVLGPLDAGLLLWFSATLVYIKLDWKIGIPFSLFTFGVYYSSHFLPLPVLWVGFVLGWIIQYVGHFFYEKNSPAFYKNLMHIFIGPIWIFSGIVRYHR